MKGVSPFNITHMMGVPSLSIVSEKQRRQVYSQEMKQVAETAETLMENICLKSSTFTSATHVEHIRGMFKVLHYGSDV